MNKDAVTAGVIAALENIELLLLLAQNKQTEYANPNLDPLNEARRLVGVVTHTIRGPIGAHGSTSPGVVEMATAKAETFVSEDVRGMAEKLAPNSRLKDADFAEVERKIGTAKMPSVNQKPQN